MRSISIWWACLSLFNCCFPPSLTSVFIRVSGAEWRRVNWALKETLSRNNRKFFLGFSCTWASCKPFSAFNHNFLHMSTLIVWSRGRGGLQGSQQQWPKAVGTWTLLSRQNCPARCRCHLCIHFLNCVFAFFAVSVLSVLCNKKSTEA